MDLEKYIELATRTESRLDTLKVNPQLVVNLLALFTASGRMLDQLKKHTFYGKDYDIDQFNGDYQSLVTTLQHLTHKAFQLNGTSDDMGEEPVDNINPRLFHAIVGIATESTEICEALYDVMTNHDQDIDEVNLMEEWADCCWYGGVLTDATGQSWEQALENNIKKLKSRYPDKFDSERALNRDTKKEREILEKGFKD